MSQAQQRTLRVTELERNIIELTGMGYDEYEIADLIEAIAPDEVKAIVDRFQEELIGSNVGFTSEEVDEFFNHKGE